MKPLIAILLATTLSGCAGHSGMTAEESPCEHARNQALSYSMMAAGLGLMANSQVPYGESPMQGVARGLQQGAYSYNPPYCQ